MRTSAVLFVVASCHSASPPVVDAAPAAAAHVLERGGALSAEALTPGVRRLDEALESIAVLEFEADTRLQAATRMVEAVARTELIKVVQVHVASYERDVATAETHEVEVAHGEAVAAAFAGAQTAQLGWAKVLRDDRPVLLVAARLVVPREDVRVAVDRWAPQGGFDDLWERLLEATR